MWSIYMIRCGDRSLYTGISNDVARRFAVHQSGSAQAAKYTRTRHPLQLVFTAKIGTKSAASRLEYYVKQLPKQTKESLVAGTISLSDLGLIETENFNLSD
jgi:putative endonuclease